MIQKDYRDRLRDIATNMRLAGDFLQGLTFDDFQNDQLHIYGVTRCLEIIGEAAKHIPEEFRDQHPGIPWKAMAGMRDKIIHSYDNVDIEAVWTTITVTIPVILPKLNDIMSALDNTP